MTVFELRKMLSNVVNQNAEVFLPQSDLAIGTKNKVDGIEIKQGRVYVVPSGTRMMRKKD